MLDVRTQDVTIISNSTGEDVTEQYALLMTQDEKERKDKQQKERDKKTYKRLCQNERGYFTMMLYEMKKALELGVSHPNVTRLMYLATYMDYDNILRAGNNTLMTKRSMQKCLRLKDDTFRNFYKDCIDAKLIQYKEDKYFLNQSVFKRGRITQEQAKNDNTMFLYHKGIREIYENSKISEHKILGYVFLVIPYVNQTFNVICKNPKEESFQEMECLDWNDVGDILQINAIRNLKMKFKRFTVGGQYIFVDASTDSKSFIFVNPQIYYTGKNWEQVEWIEGVCSSSQLERKGEIHGT